jgi:hypothetical protein
MEGKMHVYQIGNKWRIYPKKFINRLLPIFMLVFCFVFIDLSAGHRKPTSFFNGDDWAKWSRVEKDSFIKGLFEATHACRRAYDDTLKSKYHWTPEQLQDLFFDVMEQSSFSFLDATGFDPEGIYADIDDFYRDDTNLDIPIFAVYRLFSALRNAFINKKDFPSIVQKLRACDWQILGIAKKANRPTN